MLPYILVVPGEPRFGLPASVEVPMRELYHIRHTNEVTNLDMWPEKYDTTIEIAVLYATDEEGDPSGDVIVGTGEAHLLHIEEWLNDDRPCDLEVLFDMEEEGIYWFWNHLFPPNMDDRSLALSFREEITDPDNLFHLSDVLLLHSLRIDEEHRGQMLGLEVMSRTIEVFARASALTVLKAFPLDPPDNARAVAQASRKLQRYYTRIGFESIGDDGFMICRPGQLKPIAPKRRAGSKAQSD